jgi:hypothetical protein
MVAAYRIQPTLEILDFKPRDIPDQHLENLHHSILAVFPVFKIFHADPKYKEHITFVKGS